MIVLDTNVLSELIRPTVNPRVASWFQAQPAAALFTTTISRSEMLYGARILPQGARRDRLLEQILAMFSLDLAGRVLDFDSDAADAYAEIAANRRTSGKPIAAFDAMIAAIARARGAELATRDSKGFEDCGIAVIDPWH